MIGRAINHHDFEKVLSNGSSCILLKRRVLKEKNLEFLKGRLWENLGVFERTKKGF